MDIKVSDNIRKEVQQQVDADMLYGGFNNDMLMVESLKEKFEMVEGILEYE